MDSRPNSLKFLMFEWSFNSFGILHLVASPGPIMTRYSRLQAAYLDRVFAYLDLGARVGPGVVKTFLASSSLFSFAPVR